MKKIIKKFLISITILVVICGIYLIYNKQKGNIVYIFKYTYFLNTGNSMQPFINPGDLIIIKKCDEYKIDDVITYKDKDGNISTHRIIDIKNDSYQTKGDNNKFIDSSLITKDNVYGKLVKNLFNAKDLINFFNKYKPYILILIIVLLLSVGIMFIWK